MLGVRAASALPPLTTNTAVSPELRSPFSSLPTSTTPKPPPSQTLFLRHNYLVFSAPINSKKPNWVSLFLSGRRRGNGFSVSASRKGREVDGGDAAADADVDEWDEEEEEEEGEGEKLMPFEEMGKWLRNKPSGFGEGKTYDTTVEEKLLEEMEQSRNAQLVNVDTLENDPKKIAGTKKQESQHHALDIVPSGTRIRLSNLPRKKNIHRDLQLAFKGFPGRVNISPAVIGNKKTREPICKGFAFLDLESEEAANRFVQVYSKQNVLFGKVQKQITCDVINPRCSSNSSSEQSADDSRKFTQPRLAIIGDEIHSREDMKIFSWDSQESTFEGSIDVVIDCKAEVEPPELMNGTDRPLLQQENTETNIQRLNISHVNDDENGSRRNGDNLGTVDSVSSTEKQMKQAGSRKKTIKTKSVKTSKLSMPASFARLKMKDRTVLTGVFSKYGGKVPSTSSKES